jgi:hydroxylamine reductase (hybrid-cluster protein)
VHACCSSFFGEDTDTFEWQEHQASTNQSKLSNKKSLFDGPSPRDEYKRFKAATGKGCWYLYNQAGFPIVVGGVSNQGPTYIVSEDNDGGAPSRYAATFAKLQEREAAADDGQRAAEAAEAAEKARKEAELKAEHDRIRDEDAALETAAKEELADEDREDKAEEKRLADEIQADIASKEAVIRTQLITVTRLVPDQSADTRVEGVQAAMNEIGLTTSCKWDKIK